MNYRKRKKTNEYVAGRKTKYSIPDVMGKGMHIVMTTTWRVASTESADQDDEWAGLDDEMEVDFDDVRNGDLDELWD